MYKIAVIMPVKEKHVESLKKAAAGNEIIFFNKPITSDEIGQYDIIIGGPDPKLLKAAASLKLLQLSSAGVDGYTNKAIYANDNVILANASGAYGLAISEAMLAMHLAMIKKLPVYRDQMHESLWKGAGTVTSVNGSTVICVGLGDIGSQYARKVKALGAYVIGIRRTSGEKPDYLDEVYTQEESEQVLSRGDVIALSLPGTEKTKHFLSREVIASLKTGALIINVGRGSAIDTEALCDALEAGKLSGAALDVTDPEPLPKEHRLWKLPNALITPHVTGGFSLPATHDFIINIACDNISRILKGEKPSRVVNLSEGY